MGNRNSSSNFCFFLNPFSPCVGSKKNEKKENVQVSKISKSSLNGSIIYSVDPAPSLQQPNSILGSKNFHYSPLLFSQSFHGKDSPDIKLHETNDSDFALHYKSYPGNNHLIRESWDMEIENVDERRSAVVANALLEMEKNVVIGKKTLNLALKGNVNTNDMIFLCETISKAKPFHYLRLDFNRTNIKDAELLPKPLTLCQK